MRRFGRRGFWAATVVALLSAAMASPAAAATPSVSWTKSLPLLDSHWVGAAGPDGSVVVGGSAQNDARTETDGFVRRLDTTGNQVWRSSIATTGSFDNVLGLDVDGSGQVFAVGHTRGSLAGANAGDLDVFVRGLSANGATRWTDQFGTAEADYARALAVGSDGSVYAAGDTDGALATGGGGNSDGFIRKYSSSGSVAWTIEFGGSGDETVADIAVAADGSVWVVGSVAPAGTFVTDGFITRVSSSGTVQSTNTISGAFPGTARSMTYTVAPHPSGGVVVGGELVGTTSFSGFLRRYAAAGSITWTVETGNSNYDVDVSENGTVFVSGFPETGTFEEGFAGAFTSAGKLIWETDTSSSNAGFVVATTDGAVVVHGSNVLSSPGFLTKYTAGGGSTGGGGSSTFTDVPAGAFYADAVDWLKAEEITTGTSATTYSPDDQVTRGQMAAFLHRLVGEPGGSPASGFSDVPAGAFYTDAVAWLKAEGVTTGTSATTYSPDDSVTRGQMAAFLWRLAGEPSGSAAHGFSDVPSGAFYADAVAWLKAQGITTGTAPSTYSPNDSVTRGQMAAFLYRMATDSDWDYPG